MKLSSKIRYGLRGAMELAIHYDKGLVTIKTMAEKRGISQKYLEQLMGLLGSAGVVLSYRGPKGGYKLVQPPDKTSLKR